MDLCKLHASLVYIAQHTVGQPRLYSGTLKKENYHFKSLKQPPAVESGAL